MDGNFRGPLTLARRRALDLLLDRYLETDPEDQPGYIQDCRRRYPRLSVWFEALVDNSRNTISVVGGPIDRFADRINAEAMARDIEPLPSGARLGPWRVIEHVGQGGMGRVYRGERSDGAFEMMVAIKLIAFRQPGLAEQLRMESRFLARLDHPAVTRLIDAGLTDVDEPFLVMEWVPGEDLGAWMQRSQPDLAERLAVFESAARALAHAHQRLVVHGDIKPANLRVREDGQVKLVDFGVARIFEGDGSGAQSVSALTPSFAAPEQLAGEPSSTWSDIWAVGGLLHWLLTETSPTHRSAMDTARYRRWRRGLELRAIVEKACSEAPEDRYGSVPELLADLGRYHRDEPLAALPGPRGARAWKFARRHRWPLAATAAVMFSMLAGVLVSTSLYLQAERERDQAESARHAAATVTEVQQSVLASMHPEELASGFVDGLRRALAAQMDGESELAAFNRAVQVADPVDILRTGLVERVAEPAEVEMRSRMAGDPVNLAAIQHSLAEVYQRWGLYDRALSGFGEARDVRQRHLEPDETDFHTSAIRHFVALAHTGESERALEIGAEVVAAAREQLGQRHPAALEAESALGSIHIMRREAATGWEILGPVFRSRREVLGPNDPATLETQHNLATASFLRGDPEQARALLEEVISRRDAVLGSDHADTIGSRQNLGGMLAGLGDFEAALSTLEAVHAARERRLGRRHPKTLQTISNIAHVHREMGDPESARALETGLLQDFVDTLGPDHPETLRVRLNLAVSTREAGDVAAAVEGFRAVFEARKRTFTPEHPVTLQAELRLAHAIWKNGQPEPAAERMERLIDDLTDALGPVHAETITAVGYRARILGELARHDQAQALLERGIEALEAADRPLHQGDGRWLLELLVDTLETRQAIEPDPARSTRLEALRTRLDSEA